MSDTAPAAERRRIRGRRLTDKQALILELVSEGLENKEIGHRMGLSEQAVKEHVSTLLHRLAVRNRAALAEIATELKIVGTSDLDPEWLSYIFKRSPVMTAIGAVTSRPVPVRVWKRVLPAASATVRVTL